MSTRLSVVVVAVLVVVMKTRAQTPLGTEFTYQGYLGQAGVPVNDTADFLFSLFTDAVGGSQIGVTLGASDVPVTDGLFTVQPGFGTEAFNGEQRFLEIAVRSPAGSGSYTTLSPRQPLTAVPYALYALNGPGGAAPPAPPPDVAQPPLRRRPAPPGVGAGRGDAGRGRR